MLKQQEDRTTSLEQDLTARISTMKRDSEQLQQDKNAMNETIARLNAEVRAQKDRETEILTREQKTVQGLQQEVTRLTRTGTEQVLFSIMQVLIWLRHHY